SSYQGSIPLTTATTNSDNTVFAQLTVLLGPSRVRDVAHKMGIVTPIDAVPAIGLGGLRVGVSPLELAHAYATLANEGERVGGSVLFRRPAPGEDDDPSLDPILITKVVDGQGRLIADNQPRREQAVPREDALTALAMLQSVVRQGTAKRINDFGR